MVGGTGCSGEWATVHSEKKRSEVWASCQAWRYGLGAKDNERGWIALIG